MIKTPKLSRRTFIVVQRRRRRRPGPRLQSLRRRAGGSRRGRLARDRRLGGDPPRRHRGGAHRALRDGPGLAHRPRADGRRGTRVRLEEGHLGISDARRRTSRASASGATSAPAAAAASAPRTTTCARAARRRASCSCRRRPTNGRCRPPSARCRNGVITHKASSRKTSYGKVAEAAAKLDVPKDVPLKDPKDWKIIGKPLKRLDTADKLTGKQVYGADLKLPGMLNAAIKDCPVFGGKLKSVDSAKAGIDAGREEGGARARHRGRGGRRHLVACQDRARRGEDRVGQRRQREGLERRRSTTMLKAGLDAEQAFVHNEKGDAESRDRGRGEEDRGRLRLSVPEPRLHGADERDRALHGGHAARSGARRRTARRRWRRPPRPPACRSPSAT